jgi:putative peptidoglycan lipid II flippase
MSAASLRAYSPGLLGFILVKVLAPGYFARQDTRTPVRAGVQALVLGMALSVVFVVLLTKTAWAPAHAGIAAATACSALFNAGLLLRGLLRSGVYRAGAGWRLLAMRVLVPSVVMTVGLLLTLASWGDWLAMRSMARVVSLGVLVAGGTAVYFGACYLCGLRFRDLKMRIVI